MTKARDLAGFSTGSITNTTADGLILKGDGSSTDVVIKNGANATVATVSDGSTNLSVAGSVTGALARGAIQVGNSSGVAAALAKGTSGYVLTAGANDLSWAEGGGGGTEFITSSGAISNAATLDFTAFDSSKYDSYEFRFIDFLPATDGAVLRALTSSDTSNPSYDTGASDYRKHLTTSVTAAFGDVNGDTTNGNAANEGFVGIVRVTNPHTSNHTKIVTNDGAYYQTDNYPYPLYYNAASRGAGGFVREENAQVNAIRFYWSSGNIASGEVVMFGVVNS